MHAEAAQLHCFINIRYSIVPSHCQSSSSSSLFISQVANVYCCVRRDKSVPHGPNYFYPRWSVVWIQPCDVGSPWRRDLEFEFWNGRASSKLNPEDAHKPPHTLRSACSPLRHLKDRPQRTHKAPCYTLIGCLVVDAASLEGADAVKGQFLTIQCDMQTCLNLCSHISRKWSTSEV